MKLAFALQGLVNRQQPLIYYKYTSGSKDGGSDNFWLQEIQQEGKTFEDYTIIRYDSIYDLINLAKSLNAVSGVVIWDSNWNKEKEKRVVKKHLL